MLSRRSWLPGAGESDSNKNRKAKSVIMRIAASIYYNRVGWVVMLATMTGLTKTKSGNLSVISEGVISSKY